MAKRSPEEWKKELEWAMKEGDLEYANGIRKILKMEPIGTEGGGWGQRAAIGGSQGPDAQFLSAQNFDPNAQRFGEDNFVVNGQLNNPEGFDIGDVAPFGRAVAEGLGAFTGGAIGFAGGIPAGPLAIGTSMASAGIGGEIGGQLYDLGMGVFGGQEDTRDIKQRATDTAVNIGFNSMGTPQFSNPKHYIDSTAELFKPKRKAINEVQKRGGWLTAGQTGDVASAKREAAWGADPFGGEAIANQRDETQKIFEEILTEGTPMAGSREVAGESITEGIGYNMDFGSAKVSDAYKAFDEVLESSGGDRLNRISMDALAELKARYQSMIERDAGFAEMIQQDPDLSRAFNSLDQMMENAKRNAVDPSLDLPEMPTYQTIKELRSMIGKKINDAFYQGGEKENLKDLYSALTDDLDAGAFEIGGEAAKNARKTADAMNTQLKRDLELVDPVFKHADNPTKVYDTLTSAIFKNPRLAKNARTAMGQDQWDRYVDTWVRNASQTKAGQYVGGDYSTNSLLTELQRLKQQSPEGYAIMMDGREEAMAVIEELAVMARQGDAYLNRSNSGAAVGASQVASQLSASAGGAITGIVGGTLGGGVNPLAAAAGAATFAVGRTLIPKLVTAAMTSRKLGKALVAVKGKYGENLPIGADLARALVAAGAPNDEVKKIFQEEKQPPAANEGVLYR